MGRVQSAGISLSLLAKSGNRRSITWCTIRGERLDLGLKTMCRFLLYATGLLAGRLEQLLPGLDTSGRGNSLGTRVGTNVPLSRGGERLSPSS